ncbi:MAG: hypothetical protein OXB89_05090 [Anaerolineaceae bacterium]|nr:hypothetical protein [Anaerolineaceae bacterium]
MNDTERSEQIIRHLEMIQGSVQRMASNSFRLRGWSVVLVAGWLVSLARVDDNVIQTLRETVPFRTFVLLIPFMLIFVLDGYYLWQERLFRRLYDQVRQANSTDFSMDTSFGERFRQRASGYIASCLPTPSRPFSTPFLFHGAIIVLLYIVENPVA